MDIDAQAKHIRELLAFKAWAEPILLALEQGAALAEADAMVPFAPSSDDMAKVNDMADDAPAVEEVMPVEAEQEEAAPIAEQPAPESVPVAPPENEIPPPAAA